MEPFTGGIQMFARQVKRGFTLVEILIVVIILGILAAIVIPQFTNASQDARKSSLVSQLQTLRSQIELYKLQHGDQLPALITDWTPLTTQTTYNGTNFGPYMQAIPKNPLNNLSTVLQSGALTNGLPAVPAACGFVYDQADTGRIWGTDTNTTSLYVE
jgi:general secretion pathway protein G